jgi:hypothetical protein
MIHLQMIGQLLIMYRVGQGKSWTSNVTAANFTEPGTHASKTLEIQFSPAKNPSSTIELTERGSGGLDSVIHVDARDMKTGGLEKHAEV